jgi:hypothetical protein
MNEGVRRGDTEGGEGTSSPCVLWMCVVWVCVRMCKREYVCGLVGASGRMSACVSMHVEGVRERGRRSKLDR